MYKGVWVLGEERDGVIHPVSYELLAWGRNLAAKLCLDLECVILEEHVHAQKRRNWFSEVLTRSMSLTMLTSESSG
jgi:hypothetical protein